MSYPWLPYIQTNAHPPLPPSPRSPRRHRLHMHIPHVRESPGIRFAMLLCSIFLSLLFVAGLVTFILWLSLRPHRPRFYLTSFSAPDVAKGSGSDVSNITFVVLDRNPNQDIGIFYDAMGAALYYSDKRIGVTPLLAPFYQPPKNSTTIGGAFDSSLLGGQLGEDSKRGRVRFRLELSARIRFKVNTWDTHQHGMHVDCEAIVGPDGEALSESLNKRCSIYFD